jgi:sugar lactone lactonase YvrE
MRAAAVAVAVLLSCAPAAAQRPSNPALLVPQQAPPLDYVPVPNPVALPAGVEMGPAASVAFDARGHLYVLTRGALPVMEFDPEGTFVRGFGQGLFKRSHGIHIDREGNIWTTDQEAHVVMKFDRQGQVLMTLGTPGQPALFNEPTDIVVSPSGELFVSQGHTPGTGGDPKVLKLDRNGTVIKTWGSKGTGPGQFDVAHGIAMDGAGRIWVADRENQRLQVFDQEGTFVREMKYAGLPCDLHIGSEHIFMVNGFAGQLLQLDRDGKVLAALGKEGKGPGEFGEAHFVAVGPRGEIFVADVVNRAVQKFVKR